MQNHIHIAMTLTGSPEFAPAYTWKIAFPDYDEIPEVILSVKRTSKAKLRWHTIHDSNGPIQLTNYRMTLKMVDDLTNTAVEYKDRIKAMNGKQVYFIDFNHAADGVDHSGDIKLMKLTVNRIKPMTPTLSYYLIDVQLTDDNTVQ